MGLDTREPATDAPSSHAIIYVVGKEREMRARIQAIAARKIDYVFDPDFRYPDSEQRIRELKPASDSAREPLAKAPTGADPNLKPLYEVPLLTREDERYEFSLMNFLKYSADCRRQELFSHANGNTDQLLRDIEIKLKEAEVLRSHIWKANQRLIVSVAKQYVNRHRDIYALSSDGNISLHCAIENFDVSLGNKFSTYATWALHRNFCRSIRKEASRFHHFHPTEDTFFDSMEEDDTQSVSIEYQIPSIRAGIENILDQFTRQESDIIRMRYGLNRDGQTYDKPKTLEEIGNHFGVTKQRIQQIEKGMRKRFRLLANLAGIDIPER